MASITFTASNFCAGNGHYTLTVSGAKSGVWGFEPQEILGYDPTDDELRQCVRVLQSIWSNGKTPAQAKSGLLAGVTITL